MTVAQALGELRRVRRVLSSSWEILEHPHERDRESLFRLGTGRTLRICLRDRLSVERGGDPEVRSERVRASEPHQRSGPTRSPSGATETARSKSARARAASPASKQLLAASIVRRRTSSRASGGVSRSACSARSAAAPGAPRARARWAASSSAAATAALGSEGGQREVPCPFLGLLDDHRKPTVQVTPTRGTGGGVCAGGQERVREHQPITVGRDHMRRKCWLERLRVVAERRSDERHGRLRERSYDLKRLDRSLGERSEPLERRDPAVARAGEAPPPAPGLPGAQGHAQFRARRRDCRQRARADVPASADSAQRPAAFAGCGEALRC